MSEAVQALEPEEQARAFWYGVVSRLFYTAPDAQVLDALKALQPEEGETAFVRALRELQSACAQADVEAVREEFDNLFVGVGKAPVTSYTSGYAVPHAPDRFLLELRNRLGELGLARRERVFEAEDHVSAVCDAMRWHIEQRQPLEAQRDFFNTFVEAGVPAFCDAINASPLADFYRRAGDFTRAFVAVEKDAFDMHVAP